MATFEKVDYKPIPMRGVLAPNKKKPFTGVTRPVAMGSATGASTTFSAPTKTTVPSGTQLAPPTMTSTPTSTPVLQQAPPPPVQQAAPMQGAPIQGNETPYRVDPRNSSQLQDILKRLQGGSDRGSGLNSELEAEARRQLANPSVYDDELMQNAIAQGRRSLDREFAGQREGLSAELGGRGLEYGTHAAGRFGDLAAQQSYANQDLMNNILRERAASIGGSRAAAFGNAMGFQGQNFGQNTSLAGLLGSMEAGQRGEQRGERSYVDNLRNTARGQAMEEAQFGENIRRGREGDVADWTRMGMGDNPGSADLWGATDQYGSQAGNYQDLLAQLAAQFGAGAYQ